MHMTMCKRELVGICGIHMELSLVPCDDLAGWVGAGGRKVQEAGDMCIHIAGSGCCSAEMITAL